MIRFCCKHWCIDKKNTFHARRLAARFVRPETDEEGKTALQKLLVKLYQRNGGYTRIVKTGVRRGDATQMAVIQFVE